MKYAAGVDVGGTNIVCGLLDERGRILIKRKFATAPEKGPASILETIAGQIEDMREEAEIAADELVAAGLGIPGLVDPEAGVSRRAVNLRWEQVSVAAEMQRLLRRPVFIDNDVRMYAYGEAVAGAGRGYRYVYGITIGTGLAAALVQCGEPYSGHRFMAGEIGHVKAEGGHAMCNCGRIGCLETIVSATGIARQARERLAKGEQSILLARFPDLAAIRAVDVSRAGAEGDALSLDVLAHTGKTLGRALSSVVPLLSPDAIVIGGGGALAAGLLIEPMKRELDGALLHDYRGQYAVKTAELNDDAGLVGSALRALHRGGWPKSTMITNH